jgi:hypothetical protein
LVRKINAGTTAREATAFTIKDGRDTSDHSLSLGVSVGDFERESMHFHRPTPARILDRLVGVVPNCHDAEDRCIHSEETRVGIRGSPPSPLLKTDPPLEWIAAGP